MTMKLMSRLLIYSMVVWFACACGGSGTDIPGIPEVNDPSNYPDSGELFVVCDISDFTQSIIDEEQLTENLSVGYSINYNSNFQFLSAKAYVIPTSTVTEADLEAGDYDRYNIGNMGVNTDMADAKINFTYHWNTKELHTKMTYKQAVRDDRVIFDEVFEKAYLLVVGEISEYVSPTELIPYRTMCISEIPLQKLE